MPIVVNKDDEFVSDMILIVDDDEINRGILDNIFSPYYSTDEAENGRVGLEKILADPSKYCAVLLDVMMPEMNGIEVLRNLYDRGLLSKIPVFLITAEVSSDSLHEAYHLGVMDVILKPVTPYIVLRRINSIVELFRARKRLDNRVEKQNAELLENAKKIIALNQGMIEALSETASRGSTSGESATSPDFCSATPSSAKVFPRPKSRTSRLPRLCTTSEKSQYPTISSASRESLPPRNSRL